MPADSNIRLPPVTGDSNLKMEARSDVGNKATLQQSPRQARGWCKDSHGVFCMLYNVFNGDKSKVQTDNLDAYSCLFQRYYKNIYIEINILRTQQHYSRQQIVSAMKTSHLYRH